MGTSVRAGVKELMNNGAEIAKDLPDQLRQTQFMLTVAAGALLIMATASVAILFWAVTHESQ